MGHGFIFFVCKNLTHGKNIFASENVFLLRVSFISLFCISLRRLWRQSHRVPGKQVLVSSVYGQRIGSLRIGLTSKLNVLRNSHSAKPKHCLRLDGCVANRGPSSALSPPSISAIRRRAFPQPHTPPKTVP